MPAVRITYSIPTAMMPALDATWRSTLKMFVLVRKLGDQIAAAMTSTTKMPSVPKR